MSLYWLRGEAVTGSLSVLEGVLRSVLISPLFLIKFNGD